MGQVVMRKYRVSYYRISYGRGCPDFTGLYCGVGSKEKAIIFLVAGGPNPSRHWYWLHGQRGALD